MDKSWRRALLALALLHLLFVAEAAWAELPLVLLKDRPLLLVGDAPDGLARGAMLNVVLVDGKVRFEVDPAAAERAGLRLSSRLLAVAEHVVKAAAR